ncbi:hypothetical protein SAMN02745911_0938 [Aureimonas altamirensis DSM 21988]|uniref:N-acetyltransferase domain-containing protein n=1 Tax=Aureimonas altamirensis DSM 21988 TaxID=1121026 RepID=A0ABY1I7A9_9HYPH|nr:hypothetical protein SAMN02745911_0938 [Aureimonas altamirensis DSM 21988]
MPVNRDENRSGGASSGLTLRVADRIMALDAGRWNALAAPDGRGNPFLRHAFLDALEQSGSVGEETGWLPQHLLLERDGVVIGAVPAYLKLHSQGEYVFDHGWADAFERAGGQYYPKLQVAVPFTPVTGPRLLAGKADDAARELLARSIIAYVGQTGLSSAHATFVLEEDAAAFAEAGLLERLDIQYHFFNRGYATYEDFLANLSSRKRKSLKRERRDALTEGIEVEWLSGSTLTEEALDAMFAFYMDTGSRKWGRPYLNRRFFRIIAETMPDEILLIMARRDGRYIAGAMNVIGPNRLYGRYWGCIEDHPFLHFELCYNQAIDYALAHGLEVVEAGAQGDHKIARGYEPVLTRSYHYLAHQGLRRAVDEHLVRERRAMIAEQASLAAETPFRKGE